MLEVQDLTYRIKDHLLIDNISYHFQPGHLYALLGPNGSGKSTLLKSLAGIWTPTSGSVKWCGVSLLTQARQTISRIVTFVAQTSIASFDFTVTEVVAMARYIHSNQTSLNIVEDSLRRMDVWHLRHCYISQVSSGERQRVYLARALATEASILLLDEPTAQLDLCHQLDTWKLVRELADQGKTVIMSTHDMRTLKQSCSEVLILKGGRCVASGKPVKVLTPPLFQEVFNISTNHFFI